MQFFVAALQTVAPDFEGLPDPPPLEFQVSDPDVLRERLVAAGLRDVQVDTTQQERLELSTGQEAWDWMVFSNPITEHDPGRRGRQRGRSREDAHRAGRDDPRPRGRRRCRRTHRAAQHRLGPQGRRRMTGSVLVVGGGIAGTGGRAGPGAARPGLHRRRAARVRRAGGWASTCPATRCEPWPSWASPTRRWPAAYPCVDGSTATVADGCCSPWTTNSFWRDVGRPVCVRHGDLLDALALPETATVEHAQAVAARPTPAGVEVELEGAPSPRHFDFVIGADGVHSAMREAIAVDGLRPSSMTGSSWRFVADNPGVDCWTAWSGRDETFLLIPVEEGRVYGYAARTRGGDTGSDRSWLAQAAARFPEPVGAAVAQALAGR